MTFEHRRLVDADQTHDAQNGPSVGSTRNQMQRPGHPPRFEENEFVVYPAHGVGQIVGIEVQAVAGSSLVSVAKRISPFKIWVVARFSRTIFLRRTCA
jgi:CarD-like/TRCF RID domain